MSWLANDGLLEYTTAKQKLNKYKKIEMYDLDSTLIDTKSGKRFPIDKNDWQFNEGVLKCFKILSNSTLIIIITNQQKVNNDITISEFKSKIESIVKKIDHDTIVYVAYGNSIYRKPSPKIWNEYLKNEITTDNVFYCGDACGRNSDFADTDLKFSKNIAISFKTPENRFLQQEQEELNITYPQLHKIKTCDYKFKQKNKDFLILVGLPASGKTTFSKNYLQDYLIINQDTLKTKAKCLKQTKEAIKNNIKKIAIDNTNVTKKSRNIYLELVKDNNYNIRCIIFDTPYDICQHNNYFRYIEHNKSLISKITYRTMMKYYEKPSKDEGFEKIYKFKPRLHNPPESYFIYYY